MSKETAQLLDAFDALPADDKRAFAFEILSRSRELGLNAPSTGDDSEWEAQLRALIRQFQNESDAEKAQAHWKRIERQVFGVDFDD